MINSPLAGAGYSGYSGYLGCSDYLDCSGCSDCSADSDCSGYSDYFDCPACSGCFACFDLDYLAFAVAAVAGLVGAFAVVFVAGPAAAFAAVVVAVAFRPGPAWACGGAQFFPGCAGLSGLPRLQIQVPLP